MSKKRVYEFDEPLYFGSQIISAIEFREPLHSDAKEIWPLVSKLGSGSIDVIPSLVEVVVKRLGTIVDNPETPISSAIVNIIPLRHLAPMVEMFNDFFIQTPTPGEKK